MKKHVVFQLGLIIGGIISMILFHVEISEIVGVFVIINIGYWGRVITE